MEHETDQHKPPAKAELLAKKVLQTMEEAIDSKIEEYDSLTGTELERLREERIRAMKQAAARNEELLAKGHGKYDEVEERLFFKVSTDSDKVIAHFYANNTPVCEVFHKHLKELSKTHVESRFISVNAEKSPFLVDRLNIKRFPTIIIIVDGLTRDRIVGLSEFGNSEGFPREALEWRLSLKGGIKYEGEFDPSANLNRRTQITKVYKKKTIRDGLQSNVDEDDYE